MLNHTLEHSVSANDLRDLEAAVLSLSFADRWALKLGSWQAQVLATHPGQLETLKYLYKQIAESELSGNVSCKLYLVDVGSFPDFKAFADRLLTERTIPPDGYLTRKLSSAECGNYDSASVLMTEMAMLVSVADRESERIYVFVINDQPIYEFQVHLSFLVNYALFNSGRLYLHAGAVRFADRVRLFVGERGAGKSTVCLRLGQAGATVLSDDHVMIRKDDGNFFVSGCGELARVTEKTEGFLFNTPLNARANDYAGLLKKEFRIDEYFSAEPARDYPLDEIYFLARGDQLAINQISAHETTLELMTRTKSALRFGSPTEVHRYLDYFTQLAESVPAFWLTLTSDLRDLDGLIHFLSTSTSR